MISGRLEEKSQNSRGKKVLIYLNVPLLLHLTSVLYFIFILSYCIFSSLFSCLVQNLWLWLILPVQAVSCSANSLHTHCLISTKQQTRQQASEHNRAFSRWP